MSTRKKPNTHRTPSRTQREMQQLSQELQQPEPDLTKLASGLTFLLEHGRDDQIDALFSDPSCTEDALNDLDFALIETAYRLSTQDQQNHFYHIPFALLLTIITDQKMPAKINVDGLCEKKLIRQTLNLGDHPDLWLDPTLYPADLPAWQSPSAAFHYLRTPLITKFHLPFGGQHPKVTPAAGALKIYHRIILGSVLCAPDEELATEEILFGDDQTEPALNPASARELCDEITRQLGGTQTLVDITPTASEIFDIPATMWFRDRSYKLSLAIDQGLARLLETAPGNTPVLPQLHVFLPPPPESGCWEISLAGLLPKNDGYEVLFRQDVLAHPEFDNEQTLDDLLHGVAEDFGHAQIVAHDHPIPNH